MALDETFDVGADTRTGVNPDDYQVPFRFTGRLIKVSIKPGPEQWTAADKKQAAEATARARD
jgi:arylsulfatase